MLLEDLNEDCLEEIFKYLSATDLVNLYKLNKRFLEIPSQTKVFEDLCEDLSIINKEVLAKNSVQLHDFGNNICKTALLRFIDNLQCRSNMADILDKSVFKNDSYHRINDVEILTEILELKVSATSWGSLQIAYDQDLDFNCRHIIWVTDLADGSVSIDGVLYYLHYYLGKTSPSLPGHLFEQCCGDLTQQYFQNIFKNWLFAENVPNSILKTFKHKCNLLPTNEGLDINDTNNYEKLLRHIQRILEDLKTVLRENEINEKCLQFTESPQEYLDKYYSTFHNGRTPGFCKFHRNLYYGSAIDKIKKKLKWYLHKKVPSANFRDIGRPVIITNFVEEHYKSDVEYFGIAWRIDNRSLQFLLLARDDLLLFTLPKLLKI